MLKRIFSYMGEYRRYTILTIFCVIAETAFELIIPLIMADIVDVGVATGNKAFIFERGALMILCAVISLLLGVACSHFAAVCGQGLGAELRKAEFKKIQEFSFSNLDHFEVSSLITRLTNDITAIQNSVSTGLRPAFRAPTMMITALLVSFYLNAKLALIFLIAAPVLGFLLLQIILHVRPLYSRMQVALDRVNQIIQENLTAIRVVKAYVREDHEIEKFETVNQDLETTSERAFRLAALNMPAMQYVMYGTILAILWFGGRQVQFGTMKVGELTGFLSYVLQVLNSMMMISNVFMMMTRSLASGRRILEVLDEPLDLTDGTETGLSIQKGEIDFDHVSFKYRPDASEYVLSDITLHIDPGQTIGIIGPTGSAKTTLVQLIPRLYDVTSGAIRIDGHPVQSYSLEHLRDSIAMVLQKNTLFSGTVKENLRWGKEDATDEEIEEACRIACVDEFIGRLSNGYDTELGQGGVNVSGGQKQRLCLARAILKNPKVLILDDSTSAVDTATDAKIRYGLRNSLPDTTKIIIAQRISSILQADQIFILEDGKILDSGTHESLLKTSSVYRELYTSQQEGVKI
jgi:ATP-binding cassette subfamily B multidrug efflux pump